LKDALYRGTPSGQTALYDAIVYALHHLQRSSMQRRNLVVVSDGRDNVSQIKFSNLMRNIEELPATVYCVGFFDAPEDSNARALRKVAAVSGGRYFEPKTNAEIDAVFKQIAQDIRRRYTLGFVPNEQDSSKEQHKLRILATNNAGQKLRVNGRASYRIPRTAQEARERERAESQ
jgi:VWFA-related protein